MAEKTEKCLPSEISPEDVLKLKVPDLKKELKLRGLSPSGNKNELVDRLLGSMKIVGENSIDDIEEDLLNDDDDEHLDGNESVINELDKELEDSPKSEKHKLQSQSSENDKSVSEQPAPKKLILNRNNSITAVTPSEDVKTVENKNEQKESADGRKVIVLSQLTAKERLEMRAKKFGTTVANTDLVKAARAERFNLNTGSSSTDNSKSSSVNTSVDVLKQRAERFGVTTSTVISDIEKQEKLEKRKQRFGVSTTNGTSDNDKALARLERFKQPIK